MVCTSTETWTLVLGFAFPVGWVCRSLLNQPVPKFQALDQMLNTFLHQKES